MRHGVSGTGESRSAIFDQLLDTSNAKGKLSLSSKLIPQYSISVMVIKNNCHHVVSFLCQSDIQIRCLHPATCKCIIHAL